MEANQLSAAAMERIMIFIDGSNLYYGLRHSTGRTAVNFDRFAMELCGPGRRLIHTHYYNVALRQARQSGELCQPAEVPRTASPSAAFDDPSRPTRRSATRRDVSKMRG